MRQIIIGGFLLLAQGLAGCADGSGGGAGGGTDTDTDIDTDTGTDTDSATDSDTDADTDSGTDTDTDTDPGCSGVATFEDGLTPTAFLHVATDGSDADGDGSEGAPFATLEHAASQAAPGTAVRIHAGTYAGGSYVADLAGTEGAPIWIGGAPDEDPPLVDGGSDGIHFLRVGWLVVHDLEVANASANGINCDDGGEYDNDLATHHVIFRNLQIHDIGSGNNDCLKLSGVNDYFVLDSEFHACGGGMSGSGVDHVGCHRGLLARNHFHSLVGSGNAIQCKGGSEEIEIRWNLFQDSGERTVNMGGSTGFEFFRPPLSTVEPNAEARDIRVISNVIEGATASLAFVGCVGCAAVNNTIVDPDNWIFRILQETTSTVDYEFLPCADNLVQNNLVYFSVGEISTYINIGPDVDESSFTFASNLWYAHDDPSQSQPTLPVTETDAVVGEDPAFTSGYEIDSASPAYQAGNDYPGLVGDMAGRCYLDPPSIGAYEAD